MNILRKKFDSREDLAAYVRKLAPWAEGQSSSIEGGRDTADIKIRQIEPIEYARTRNFGDGKVSRLSPYIHHGIISLNEVRNFALTKCTEPQQINKFIQELAWRDFWQYILKSNPEWAWEDVEPYKTGFLPEEYADKLPEDISQGKTGIACIDTFIHELITTGYIHNHARMYLASYIVHFRNIKWQAGAQWFLRHLLDGNIASNNLSWQLVNPHY